MAVTLSEELPGLVHTTSTVTPSTVSSSKVMEQVRVRLEPMKTGVGKETSTEEGGRTATEKSYT